MFFYITFQLISCKRRKRIDFSTFSTTTYSRTVNHTNCCKEWNIVIYQASILLLCNTFIRVVSLDLWLWNINSHFWCRFVRNTKFMKVVVIITYCLLSSPRPLLLAHLLNSKSIRLPPCDCYHHYEYHFSSFIYESDRIKFVTRISYIIIHSPPNHVLLVL